MLLRGGEGGQLSLGGAPSGFAAARTSSFKISLFLDSASGFEFNLSDIQRLSPKVSDWKNLPAQIVEAIRQAQKSMREPTLPDR
jgi:hypothetical protein